METLLVLPITRGRRGRDAAPRAVRRLRGRCRRHGYAAISQVHQRPHWAAEFGTSDDAAQFAAIYRYSPLHHVKAGVKYPPTLLTTADHDDRVVPAHSFKFASSQVRKFAAALQAAQAGDAPILLRVETNAGHGAGKPTSKALEEAAGRWAFFANTLRVEPANLPR